MQQSNASSRQLPTQTFLRVVLSVFVGAGLLVGCSDDSGGDDGSGGVTGSLTAQSFFNDEVLPAMDSAGCVGCHSSGMAPYLAGTDPYATILDYTPTQDGASSMINTATPADSHLITYPSGGEHPGGALPDDLETLILDWIGRE